MIARTSLGVVLLLAALMPTGAEFDSRFDGESAVVQGSIESYRGGSGGSTSSPGSSGASGGSGVLVVPVMVCSRVDTVVMGTAELSQCVRSDGVGSGAPLSSIVEPLVDSDGNPLPPDPAAAPPLIVTASDLQSLPILRGEVLVQPPGGRALINVEVIGYSTARPHVLDAVVMGTPVQVRLTPVRWDWLFDGDDTGPFWTDHPGGPYPNMSVHGWYSATGQDRTVTSAITWMGEYRVNGTGPWLLVAGNATTTVTSTPFETIDAPVRLVASTLTDP